METNQKLYFLGNINHDSGSECVEQFNPQDNSYIECSNADFMKDELTKKIEDLTLIIDVAEENYKTALETKLDFSTLREMKGNIRQLKLDLQVLKDQQSVKKTGELPAGDSPDK